MAPPILRSLLALLLVVAASLHLHGLPAISGAGAARVTSDNRAPLATLEGYLSRDLAAHMSSPTLPCRTRPSLAAHLHTRVPHATSAVPPPPPGRQPAEEAITEEDGCLYDVIIELREQVDAWTLREQMAHGKGDRTAREGQEQQEAILSDRVAGALVEELQATALRTQLPLLAFLRHRHHRQHGDLATSTTRDGSTSHGDGQGTVRSLWIINAISVRGVSRHTLQGLVQSFPAHIRAITPDRHVFLSQPPHAAVSREEGGGENHRGTVKTAGEDGLYAEPNLVHMQASDMWALGYEGRGITVCTVDTGVDALQHGGIDHRYRGRGSAGHAYNWWDPYHASKEPHDTHSHGTHCTGIMVGSFETGDTRHMIGVAPQADFMACLGMDGQMGSTEKILSCWQFALAPTDLDGRNPDPTRRAHVINNSWGIDGDGDGSQFESAADQLRAAGIFVVFAAGNDGDYGCGTVAVPAVFENVFSVCAVNDETDKIASFSSRGPIAKYYGTHTKPDVCAPGVQIYSSIPGNAYTYMSGTSMAAPHVAGAVALLWEAVPELARDVNRTEQVLKESARHKYSEQCNSDTAVPNNVYGHGDVRVLNAYYLATNTESGESSGNPGRAFESIVFIAIIAVLCIVFL